MQKILNPIVNDGSTIICTRYYEVCLIEDKPNIQIAIFIYENRIFLYRIDYDFGKLEKTTLIDFGECEPANMDKAVKTLKNNI